MLLVTDMLSFLVIEDVLLCRCVMKHLLVPEESTNNNSICVVPEIPLLFEVCPGTLTGMPSDLYLFLHTYLASANQMKGAIVIPFGLYLTLTQQYKCNIIN